MRFAGALVGALPAGRPSMLSVSLAGITAVLLYIAYCILAVRELSHMY